MKGEIWKDIEGYEGLYQISSMGRVKSLERTVWNKGKGCYRIVSERIRKRVTDKDGYLKVMLWKDSKGKWFFVHRLVATAFIPNPDNLPVINHKDENKENNIVSNLEWCSVLHNNTYNGRAERIGKKRCKPVFSIDRETGLIMFWESLKEAENCTGIRHGDISKCCQGKVKSAGNHIWFYADDDDNE